MEKNHTRLFERYRNINTHGLFMFRIRNKLARKGFDINPYYWVQEEFKTCEEPIIKGNPSEYSLKYIDASKLKLAYSKAVRSHLQEVLKGLEKGQQCIGLEHKGKIATLMSIEFNDCIVKNRLVKLKNNEVYLLNMFTFHSYRKKNLAPYLRYQVYRLLEKQGINIKYSITQYFNKSSIKFKRKLNSKHLKLYISVILFKKYHWNFLLKKYK